MKKIYIPIIMAGALLFTGCQESDFSDDYSSPSKIAETTVDKQFAGFMVTNKDYVLPSYPNYFIVLRTTLTRYNQAVGWVNATNQYVPGEAGIARRWDNYYNMLAQYRELEKVYDELTPEEQNKYRVFMLTATIYLYDHTQKVVDLHGDIPFNEAGMLSQNGGDYIGSLAPYDNAEDLYTMMLDNLKTFADELNNISFDSGTAVLFNNQDFLNGGDLDLWKKYCNSLRLRMLTRVSGVSSFESRADSEIASILNNPGSYPIIESNDDNIQIEVTNLDTPINSQGFETGLEDWDGNLASKAMMDHMNTNADPRLRAMFEPGESAGGVYNGLDPLLTASEQEAAVSSGELAIYNRTTLSRNDYFPGVLMNASQVSFLVSEYYLGQGNDAMAKTAYETGIRQSIEFYYWLNSLSADNAAGELMPTDEAEISAYLMSPGVSWDAATTGAEKLGLIGEQKWIHFNVVQSVENWSELRRMDLPELEFQADQANPQTLPPMRWIYPSGERIYNTENYNQVSASDNLTTKIFWDVN
ncbi:SusD/RagB family nutrient-binding outer membrane lipoprotein [Zhouia amylolytica]|nr:SusD/RagB family nutrient-binding outer membrane lipoprotein [Zhouia amylolytica]